MTWARRPVWVRDGGAAILVSSAILPLSRLTAIDRSGVSAGVLWRHRWPWRDIAVVSWDQFRGLCFLTVCVFGDPRPRLLPPGVGSQDAIRSALSEIGEFVQEMGDAAVDTGSPVSTWWPSSTAAQPLEWRWDPDQE